jgi:hypothetical protein
MSTSKNSGNKITKNGAAVKTSRLSLGPQDPNAAANVFSTGVAKVASLNVTAGSEYSVTQSQSFFYSPELNIMGS